jgi:hypothetical protein
MAMLSLGSCSQVEGRLAVPPGTLAWSCRGGDKRQTSFTVLSAARRASIALF